MGFNRSDLRDVSREEITVDPSGGVWGDAKLDQYINLAHRKLQKDLFLGFPANENNSTDVTTDGSLEYTFTRTGTVRVVKIGNQVLDPTTKNDLLLHSELNSSGNPSKYYISGDIIGFDVKPSGVTVNIFHDDIIDDFTDDTTESTLPDTDEVKMAIASWVKYLAWKKQKGQRVTALESKEEYMEIMNELRSEYWNRQKHSFNLDRIPNNNHGFDHCDSAYNNSS